MARRPIPAALRIASMLGLLTLAWLAQELGWTQGAPFSTPSVEPPPLAGTRSGIPPRDRAGAGRPSDAFRDAPESESAATDADARRVARAFEARESGFMVTLEGRVDRLLADDREGSRHQRFLMRLENGPTLLVAHNIDLADRAPVEVGDRVRLRGQYEWNERGGVLHWTHHDPDGSHPEGWIEVDGVRVE